MNFTREPIIETIITPKEGYRLVVRNSKGASQEEYSVDAIEVVSFGPAIFYRSLERPKPFLVPVADFEVIEVKETRVVLKNVNLERSIKIGGGREVQKPQREQPVGLPGEESASAPALNEGSGDKKRDRRHRRRRRDRTDVRDERRPEEGGALEHLATPAEDAGEGGVPRDETPVSSPSFTTLFPPPTTLISQTIARYKDQTISEGNVSPQPLESKQEEEKQQESTPHEKEEPEEPRGEVHDLHRTTTSYSGFPSDTFYMT